MNPVGQPIDSVSLGLPAVFLFGESSRTQRTPCVRLSQRDVVVWSGPARLRCHSVIPLADGHHARLGNCCINLTFRKAGSSGRHLAGDAYCFSASSVPRHCPVPQPQAYSRFSAAV